MPRLEVRSLALFAVICVTAASVALTGCGGGGGNGAGSSGAASVTATSFPGFPAVPGGGLPPIFRDEVLAVTFSRPVDTTIFGGLFQGLNNMAQPFTGFSSQSASGQSYYAFADQAAAQAAFQVHRNVAAGTSLHPGIVGIAVDDPKKIVFDPKIAPGNVLNLAPSQGFSANTQYDLFIPAASALTTNGEPVGTFGALPPVNPPAFTPSPGPAQVLLAGPGFAPDIIRPRVTSIASLTLSGMGLDPASNPIPHNDTLVVTFSEPIDPATIDRLTNILIMNTSLQTSSAAITSPAGFTGIIVPVSQAANVAGTTFMFTPDSFGAGPFTIHVEVVGGNNVAVEDAIKDLPSGTAGTQNTLENSLFQNFTTAFAAGQMTGSTVSEDFESTTQQDGGFVPRFEAAQWNQPLPPLNAPSNQLRGLQINGAAFPVTALGTGTGKRTQLQFTPNGTVPNPPIGCATVTCFFNAPFDTNVQNLGATVNPNGGSHLQLMYLSNNTELPMSKGTCIELLEWGTPSNVAAPISYPGFRMLMGHTSSDAASTASIGFVNIYAQNFDFNNPQNDFLMPTMHPDPFNMNPLESPVTVIPPTTYSVASFTLAGQFIPYPFLSLVFDFDDNRMEANAVGTQVAPNLAVDIDIPPPVVEMANQRNVIVGTNASMPVPVRRLINASGATTALFVDPVIYHSRLTFVKKNSSARTLFYDLGSQASMPNYINLDIFPTVDTRPAGTAITIKLQGADAVMGGNPTVGDTGLKTYVTRSGTVQQSQLDLLDGKRFFRVQFEFESNTTTNAVPFINGFLLGYSFF